MEDLGSIQEEENGLTVWDRFKNLSEKKFALSDKGKATVTTAVGTPILFESIAHMGNTGMAHMGNIGLGVSVAATILSFLHGDKAIQAGKWLKEKMIEDNGLHPSLPEEGSFSLKEKFLKDNGLQPHLGEEKPSLRSKDNPNSENLIPVGKDRKGKAFERTLKQLKSVIILGLQEGGKTNSAIHILRYAVQHGARLAIIDKHARSEEDSMTQKIQCLDSAFDCPFGFDPSSSMSVVQHVRNILDDRIEGASCEYPLILVVDEFSAIMRQKEEGGKWADCGTELAGLIEDINMEGRKHKVFCICIGQITNVSRSGGSEIRELFATRIAHAMSAKQASLFGFEEEKRQVQSLEKGEVFFQTEGTLPFWLKIPYVEDKDLRAIILPRTPKMSDLKLVECPVVTESVKDYLEDDVQPLNEREQLYHKALNYWQQGYQSIRSLMAPLELNFNQTRELLEEMDELGLVTWRKNGAV